MTTFLNVKNNAISALASAITSGATSLTVISGDGSKFPSSNFNITIDDEILNCSSRSGDVLTVSRAQEDTTASAHAVGAIVSLNLTAKQITDLQTALNALETSLNDLQTSIASLYVPLSNTALRVQNPTDTTCFAGKINGAPTATTVVYNNDTKEGSLVGIQSGSNYWGRIMLWNSTRSTYRKIVTVNTDTNTITTESSNDSWASGDNITTDSPVCSYSTTPYFELDLSASVPSTAKAVMLSVQLNAGSYTGAWVGIHPFTAYDGGKMMVVASLLAGESTTIPFLMPVYSQKICMTFVGTFIVSLVQVKVRGLLY